MYIMAGITRNSSVDRNEFDQACVEYLGLPSNVVLEILRYFLSDEFNHELVVDNLEVDDITLSLLEDDLRDATDDLLDPPDGVADVW
jgi:hypothetical protein